MPPKFQKRSYYWLSVVLILLVAFWLRVHNLVGYMPIWGDESFHIGRAYEVMLGNPFAGLQINKWLFGVLLAAFQPGGFSALFIARLLSVLFGVATAAGVLSIGRKLYGTRVGLIAALVYAVLPMATWHERQAIFDPMMAALGTAAMVVSIVLAHKPKWTTTVLLGIILALTFLTKLLGFPFLVMPLVAGLLLASHADRKQALIHAGAALAIAGVIIFATYQLAFASGLEIGSQFQPTLENTAISSPGASLIEVIIRELTQYWHIVLYYLLVLVPLLALLTIGRSAITRDNWQAVAFLVVPAFLFAAVPILAEKPTNDGRLPPRYLLFCAGSMIILASAFIDYLWSQKTAWAKWAAAAGIGLVVLPSLVFNFRLQANIEKAWLVPGDTEVYLKSGVYPGHVGRDRAAHIIIDLSQPDYMPYIVTAYSSELWALIGPSEAAGVLPYQELTYHRVAYDLVQAGHPVYILDSARPNNKFKNVYGVDVEGAHGFTFKQVLAMAGQPADEMYLTTTAKPGALTEEYNALFADLERASPDVVAYFPWTQKEAYDDVPYPVYRFDADAWPLVLPAAREAAQLLSEELRSDKQLVELIVADEANSDPNGIARQGMAWEMYYVGEVWYGPLHRITFLNGPSLDGLPQQNIAFEGSVTMHRAVMLDVESAPGDFVRVAVQWSTRAPFGDSFKAFLHILDQNGNLVAQHDAIPLAGSLPTTSWPGSPEDNPQLITDRFAVQLPEDLPDGQYRVITGLYNPADGRRLRALDPAADHIEIGILEVSGN